MLDQITAESVGVPNEVAKGSRGVGSSLFFLVSKKLNKERNTRLQMFIEHIVVEASISNSKASKLPGVSIRVSAALNGGRDKPKLEQFLVKEASMSAQISNEVADLRSD